MTDEWRREHEAAGWETDYVKLAIRELQEHVEDAERVYFENRKAGEPVEALGYDAGRVAGLKEALSVLDTKGRF